MVLRSDVGLMTDRTLVSPVDYEKFFLFNIGSRVLLSAGNGKTGSVPYFSVALSYKLFSRWKNLVGAYRSLPKNYN